MEELFKNIELKGAYKEAHEEAIKLFDLSEEEAKAMESVAGLVQIIAGLEKLPLELELTAIKGELKIAQEEARKLKAKANALEEANKKLQLENNNLLASLKAMKELSVAEDKINEVDSKLDPTFLAFVDYVNKNRE